MLQSSPSRRYWQGQINCVTHLLVTSCHAFLCNARTACASREPEPCPTGSPLRLQVPTSSFPCQCPGYPPQQILGHQQTSLRIAALFFYCGGGLPHVRLSSWVVLAGSRCRYVAVGTLVAISEWMTATFPFHVDAPLSTRGHNSRLWSLVCLHSRVASRAARLYSTPARAARAAY
jgi:hypothetical protein